MLKAIRYITLIWISFYSITGGRAAAQRGYTVADKVTKTVTPIPLEDVRLLNSPFKHAMDKNAAWLLSLEPDRFLNRFRENAGLKAKGKLYGGWEARGVSGHSLGHYLSACAIMYAASGDQRFKKKVDYIVAELAECQQTRKTGYVGGIPDEDKIFDEIAAGNIRSQGFDLNGGWVPWYTVHKVLAGLLDAYLYTANKQARAVAAKFGDWIDVKFKNLTEAQFQKMLACEHGGMNEALANLYAITGNKKYLKLSYRFRDKHILNPLAEGRDVLPGIHANTQIPKIIGSARQYELTGNAADLHTANFFWNTVVNHYSYVTGGNSDYERFSDKPDHLAPYLSTNSTETCNSYNMLKLTGHLFEHKPSAVYMDYYERVLYNHILASQNPENGMVLYYLTLAAGTEKQFGTPEDSFWCCTGTGMENHTKYGQDIYYNDSNGGLYINLFIPSVLSRKDKKMTLQIDTKYPEDKVINLWFKEFKQTTEMPLYIRYPKWATKGAIVTINGRPVNINTTPGHYIKISRKWKKGDKVQISYPMGLYTESLPDDVNKKAFLYGPLVLAGQLGTGNIKTRDIPVFISTDQKLDRWIKPDNKQPDLFYASTNGKEVALAPLYKVYNQKQAVYWDFFSTNEWNIKQRQFEAERKEEEELKARTVDIMRVGEMQPERDHNFKGECTNTGNVSGNTWRDATNGGWFSFTMATKGVKDAELQCTYLGTDGTGREFDIIVNGQKIATEKLTQRPDPRLYHISYAVPQQLLNGKQNITVRLQALPGKTAGGLFGCRLLKM